MRTVTLLATAMALLAGNSLAATVEESTKPDGTHTVITRILSFALGPNQGLAASALVVVAVAMLAAAVWLVSSRSSTKREYATQVSVSVPGKGSAKASLGVPALLIVGAIVLLALAAIVATLQPVYTATI